MILPALRPPLPGENCNGQCFWLRLPALAPHRPLERWLGVLLIGIMVIAITIQVFTRYVLGRPIVWVEEAAA